MTKALDSTVRLHAFNLTEADVQSRVWAFGAEGRPPYSRHVVLLPRGRIGGHAVEHERSWRVEDGKLAFLDQYDRRSTVFEDVAVDSEGRLVLSGRFRLAPGVGAHVLQEVAPISRLASSGGGLEVISRRQGRRRRNLVVLRANEHSLHKSWPLDMAETDRNWDLCVSFYGREENYPLQDFSEYQVLQNKQKKYTALYDLLHQGSPLWDYDYIALPDDDLMMSWRDINTLFAVCREFNLELAQPSLSLEGHVAHRITGRNDKYVLRYVSFVESMFPIFSRAALYACVPTFPLNESGFGLDNIWPKLIGEPHSAIGIIDKVSVAHTRPLATQYDLAGAVRDGNQLQARYDAPSRVVEFGGIQAAPRDMQPWAPEWANQPAV